MRTYTDGSGYKQQKPALANSNRKGLLIFKGYWIISRIRQSIGDPGSRLSAGSRLWRLGTSVRHHGL